MTTFALRADMFVQLPNSNLCNLTDGRKSDTLEVSLSKALSFLIQLNLHCAAPRCDRV